MGLEKVSPNFRWVLSSLLASAAVIEFQISNLSLSKLKYNIDQQSTEKREDCSRKYIQEGSRLRRHAINMGIKINFRMNKPSQEVKPPNTDYKLKYYTLNA
jgi:hypothetical protein